MLVMDEQRSHPVGGIDYPQTLQEFDEWFATEDNCARYLMRLRWPQAFHCPSCGSQESWLTSRSLLHCKQCIVKPPSQRAQCSKAQENHYAYGSRQCGTSLIRRSRSEERRVGKECRSRGS